MPQPVCLSAHAASVVSLPFRCCFCRYSVQRSSDNAEKDIGVVSAGGIVDTAAVALFCPQSTEQCTVQRIYDQSPKGNHLATGIKGITAVNATRQQFMIGAGGNGKLFYAAVFEGGMGYVTNSPHPLRFLC